MTTEQQTQPATIFPDGSIRCHGCGKVVAWRLTPPYKIMCRHCKAVCEHK